VFAAFILRSGIAGLTWGDVVIAMAGLGVLTLSGLSIGFGEALIFVAALMYALDIVGLGCLVRLAPGRLTAVARPLGDLDWVGVPLST
jgi:hypothetical protein